jgi:hypothetical protein
MLSFIKTPSRQYQGMSRFISFHKCFDDEICICLDGDDWLFDTFVLDSLNEHFTQNNILVSYGSYYIYDDSSKIETKAMNIEYNNKICNIRQYPKNVIENKTYRNYDWICGHLRCSYAKLLKAIEIKHFLAHDGMFIKMASDCNEMYHILEMANNRHLNICKPLMIYNKCNSKKYDTSYYNMNRKDNISHRYYRQKITNSIKSRPIYSTIDWSINCLVSPILIEYIDVRDITKSLIIDNNKCDYFAFYKNKKELQNNKDWTLLHTSQPFIISEKKTSQELCATILLNQQKYLIKKILKHQINQIKNLSIDPGFYNRQKLIDCICRFDFPADEIIMIPVHPHLQFCPIDG